MKLCFLVPWITKGRGGTENVGQMMANAMQARGHAVEIITFDDARQPSRWPLAGEIALHHLPEAPETARDSQLMLTLASIAPDLVVGLHMNRTFLAYVRAARKLGLPVVLSEHQDPRFPARLGSFAPHEREIAFQGATRLHLLTDSFVETVPAHLRDRVHVIPNTVPPAPTLADPAGPAGGGRILITVARLVDRKNLSRLIDEFARVAPDHPDWQLRVVGGGPLRKPLAARAGALGLDGRVVFTGELDDVYAELAAAQAFVLPSLFEGFPMSSLEALAHGLPVVGFAACNGLNEQVVHEENGLLAAQALEPGALAVHLDRVMGDAALRARMGAASLARYRAHYANPVIFDRWEALFAEAAAQDLPPRLATEIRLQAEFERFVFGEMR